MPQLPARVCPDSFRNSGGEAAGALSDAVPQNCSDTIHPDGLRLLRFQRRDCCHCATAVDHAVRPEDSDRLVDRYLVLADDIFYGHGGFPGTQTPPADGKSYTPRLLVVLGFLRLSFSKKHYTVEVFVQRAKT